MTILAVGAVVAALACTMGEPSPARQPVPGEPRVLAADTAVEPAMAMAVGRDSAEAGAAGLLERARKAYERTVLDSALVLSAEVVNEHAGTAAATPARWVAARAAFALGRYEEARSYAEASASSSELSAQAREEARTLASLAADAVEPPAGPAVVGAILPRTGSRILVRYADWVLEGIRLAVQEAELRQGRPIELVVVDDSGGARTREAVAELERRGALAIVGPLLPQQLSMAAGSRQDDQLLLVSPTIPELPVQWPRTYTLSAGDTRGAQDLGTYAADLGLSQAAVLYMDTPEFRQQAQAFAVEYEARGGRIKASVPYDSGTTTFSSHMERILQAVAPETAQVVAGVPAAGGESGWLGTHPTGTQSDTVGGPEPDPWRGRAPQEPFALFVAAPERDVPQIAPQVSFYGLDSAGVQVFGDADWTAAPVRRLVPNRDLEGVLAVSHFPPGRAEGLADPDFVRLYEDAYRHSLSNQLPALGYDAADLVLQALPNRLLTPAATAMRFDFLAGIRGATGVLSVRGGRVVRTPFLVVIRKGELAPAPYPWEYTLPLPKPPLPPDTLGERKR